MSENVRGQEELSIGDIFKILLRKIKILLLVLLAGIVVGASLGVLTTFNVKYYGTSVEFYVNPKLDSSQIGAESQYGVYGTYTRPVMDNMVRLLASDSFTEQLLLDEDGMPKFRNQENKTEIDNAIAAARPKVEAWKTAKDNAKKASENTVKAQVAFNEKVSEWNMKKQMSEDGETVKDEHGNVITSKQFFEEVQTALDNAKLAEKEAQILEEEAYKEAYVDESESELSPVNKVYNLYRKTDLYKELVETVRASVTYSYYDAEETTNVDALAKSFIYVNISVLNDNELASALYSQILVILPQYVADNMAIPSGYSSTNCQRITRLDSVELVNKGYTVRTAVKYALLFALAAFVVACIAVVIVDRSDKKLRDYEATMEKLNVPVLGVIPSIDEKMEEVTPSKEN